MSKFSAEHSGWGCEEDGGLDEIGLAQEGSGQSRCQVGRSL